LYKTIGGEKKDLISFIAQVKFTSCWHPCVCLLQIIKDIIVYNTKMNQPTAAVLEKREVQQTLKPYIQLVKAIIPLLNQ
jgi:hypothetical protein